MTTIERINKLKKERKAVILAHYYVNDEVQAIADHIGDSFYLSKVATTVDAETILFCGVTFMGESAKILNPQKTVVMPDMLADCPMAHMADIGKIDEVRAAHEDVAVVCYINSTAELKACSDVCVTSSNALRIVSALPNRDIYFIPDENLGRYVASKLPEKHFIFNDGFCHVHKSIKAENVRKAREAHPDAPVLVHPECTMDVIGLADYVGSTSGIIDRVAESAAEEFIIGTEMGILYELKRDNPGKRFYSVGHRQFCPNMKRITLEKVADALEKMENTIEMEEGLRRRANEPLKRMLELAK